MMRVRQWSSPGSTRDGDRVRLHSAGCRGPWTKSVAGRRWEEQERVRGLVCRGMRRWAPGQQTDVWWAGDVGGGTMRDVVMVA